MNLYQKPIIYEASLTEDRAGTSWLDLEWTKLNDQKKWYSINRDSNRRPIRTGIRILQDLKLNDWLSCIYRTYQVIKVLMYCAETVYEPNLVIKYNLHFDETGAGLSHG